MAENWGDAGSRPWRRVLATARLSLITEALSAERERWPLWIPVGAGIGILGYFSLPTEPARWSGAMAIVGALAAYAFSRGRTGAAVAVAVLAIALGFSAAQLGTARVDGPMLESRVGPAWVEGRVVGQTLTPNGVRLVLADPAVDRLAAAETPSRVRVRLLPGSDPVATGARIGVRAVLNPPSRPVIPGGFDFRRHAFFQGIGGVGYAVGHPRLADGDSSRTGLWLESLRRGIAARIWETLDGDRAAIATALMTGDRGAIRGEIHDAIRDAGLAHLLAISGLHLGLVAGLVFFAVRAGLALVPSLALEYPIKKWAAIAALAGGFAYMFIVGATVPTQRAFVMAGLVLVAVLVDRTAISMRLAAWAAALVLAVSPYSLLGPSFQMSFAAVIALIAGYEALRHRLAEWRSRAGPVRLAALYFGGVLLSTAIASTATAPFALYHFQQIASYGLITNLLAVPLTALWIMPFGLAAYLLMPLGLDFLALIPMGWGISALLAIAEAASGWPHAALRIAASPDWALALAVTGGLWLCLWNGRWRYWGIVGILAGQAGLVWPKPGPDVLVSEDGQLMAVRTAEGGLALSGWRRDRFTRDIWLRADGRAGAQAWPQEGTSEDGTLSCDLLGCLYRRDGIVIALVRDPRALAEDCVAADIVFAAVPVPRSCGAETIIDRFDVWRHGAHAISLTPDGPAVDRVADGTGLRPWTLDRRPEWERAGDSD